MRRRIFLPMTRVTAIDAGQVITTGLVNMRRFEQRPGETLVLAEMLDRQVTLLAHRRGSGRRAASPWSTSGMEQDRTRRLAGHRGVRAPRVAAAGSAGAARPSSSTGPT